MTISATENKYLEKIASSKLGKAINFVDDLIGHSHAKFKAEAGTLSKAEALGRRASHAIKDTEAARSRMVTARTKTGLGVAATGTAGFLGIHKYHQHRDNAIMAKIDKMYVDPNN